MHLENFDSKNLSDQKLQVLHDHYKDTFSLQREYLKFRDRLFIYVLTVVAIMVVFMIIPTESSSVLANIAKEKLGSEFTFNQNAINTVIWFVTLCLVLRYYQINIVVEKQYQYLHKIEPILNQLADVGQSIFHREGLEYLNKFKFFSTVVFYLYTLIFPAMLLTVTGYKAFLEIMAKPHLDLILFIDLILCGLIYSITIIYTFSLHRKIKVEANKGLHPSNDIELGVTSDNQ